MGFVRRRTRRRTMLLAGGAAYAAGRYQGRQRAEEDMAYQDEPQYEEAPPAPPPPAPTQDTQADEIQRLADMHAAGNLTDEEFAAAKAKVLGI